MAKQEKDKHIVTVADAELAYSIEGAGKPLLVVGSSIYYPRTFSQALRQSCLLIFADLPHFSRLPADFDYSSISFDLYAQCIEAVRRSANIGRVAVVGHSHHGNIALEYAKRFPDSVTHVVLIGSPPVNISQTVQGSAESWRLHASETRKAVLARRRSALLESITASSLKTDDGFIQQYVADAPLYWNDPNYDAAWLWKCMVFDMQAIDAFRNLFKDYELDWNSALLKAPVLIVMGKNDFAVSHSLWKKILPRLQNYTFRLLDKSGHTPQLEQPEEFDRLLLHWLGDG